MYVGLVIYGDLEPTSGGYRYDRRLVEALRDRGDRVEVISLPETGYYRSLAHNVSRGLWRALDRPFDVLLQDELCHPSLLTPNYLDREYPIVSIVHHLRIDGVGSRIERRFSRLLERNYLESVDAAVCVSRATREAVSRLAGVPGTVAWPGRDRFDPRIDDAAIRERAHDGALEVLFVGNLVPRKGLDTLIEGLARVRGDWQLTVVGESTDPDYAGSIRRSVEKRGLADRVTWTGWLDDEALAERFTTAHLLAVPSTHEGFGMVYLEGMGFGLPALATTSGGASDLVTDGKTGFLVEPGDPGGVARAVGSVIDDRDRLTQMGIAARRRYERHPTWDDTAGRIRAFLETQVGKR